MNPMDQFEESEGAAAGCAVCEAMLPDAVDGLLNEAEQRAFDRHVAGCVECARELAAARRGAAWLGMLKTQAPEPPAGMLERILAGTAPTAAAPAPLLAPSVRTATPAAGIAQAGVPTSVPWGMNNQPSRNRPSAWAALQAKLSELFWLQAAQSLLQPRLAMTAAMAFFSIALTLNLTGVRLRDLRAANLTPSALRRTVADAGASVSRTVQNNRVVYQLESRVSELREDDGLNGPNQPRQDEDGTR
jgi:anti-sigma factor RsiW